ncbi:MAG: hypothetical protein ACJ744_03005 [Gaiellaceae bacterium]|jgi:hypothetical protein
MTVRAVAAFAAVALLAAPVARADGDPASDYLITRQTFLPFNAKIPKAQVDQLNGIVADANEKGFKIRVAIISKPFDLGAVPSLWRKPKTYARFLGQELTFVYKNRLLIVMPNGYGVSRGGKALPDAQRVVDTLPAPGAGGPALAAAATRAVRRLAADSGVTAEVPPSTESTTDDRLVIAGAAIGLVLLILAGFGVRRLLARP